MKNFLQKSTNNSFKVSAIVPCYNGEELIEKRLESIINQSSKPYEIIFLDDGSDDNSISIAKNILKKSHIKHKTIINKNNLGTKNQILKGINVSKGDYIWFAGQYDFCHEDFLSTIKEMFNQEAINIAYCNSAIVNQDLEPIDYYKEDLILNNSNNLCIDGTSAVINNLCVENTIPSFSAVVFRKESLNGIEEELENYKVLFDWIIYLYVLRNGKINYNSSVLNTVISHEQNQKIIEYYEDLFNLKNYILKNYDVSENLFDSMLFQIEHEFRENGYEVFGISNILEHPILGNMYTELQNELNELRM